MASAHPVGGASAVLVNPRVLGTEVALASEAASRRRFAHPVQHPKVASRDLCNQAVHKI